MIPSVDNHIYILLSDHIWFVSRLTNNALHWNVLLDKLPVKYLFWYWGSNWI